MKILLLGTGGTIACLPGENGLAPSFHVEQLLKYVHTDVAGVVCRDLFQLDSSNIQPEEWRTIAAALKESIAEGYEAIVISHGTDTLAYTASMLSFILQGVQIPIVLTGAQYPIAYPDSDGKENLTNAIIAARSLPGGVYICFGDRVILGSRSVKVRSTSLNAFESINYPNIGTIAQGRYIPLHTPPVSGGLRFSDEIDPNVALIKLVPGTSPALFDMLPGCGISGLVVEGFGLGGVHNMRRNHAQAIERLLKQGMPVVLTTQCLYEFSTPDVYEVSRSLAEAGVISAGDMTTEAAVTKLMWVLGHTRDMDQIRKLMQTSLCGEINL